MAKKGKKKAKASAAPADEPPKKGSNWWHQFKGFTPDPTSNLRAEFNRLAQHMGWTKAEKKQYWPDAVDAEYEFHFQQDRSKLEGWQELCREVRIEEIPSSITQCKKALKSPEVLVNLVDLVSCRRTGGEPIRFSSKTAFVDFTLGNGYIYPKQKAKEEGFIKALLRKIPFSRRRRGGGVDALAQAMAGLRM
ncbi:hypothetical protein M011DRAFT_477497 [Sporormia fimetaria CBS 119925]|uniref:Uncharacterized protein n=1 Tax=Sporormia fimetaria CBS 119925 TaxID=1340428 RepID=A0A6A6VD45_9PLEO|nr:hypothetical protein M011DRAFT_477497 [Sporormia fimetaria CBS 119925]